MTPPEPSPGLLSPPEIDALLGQAQKSLAAVQEGRNSADEDRASAVRLDMARITAIIDSLAAQIDDPKTNPAKLHALIGAEMKARYYRRQLLARPGKDNPVKAEHPPQVAVSGRGRSQAAALRGSSEE